MSAHKNFPVILDARERRQTMEIQKHSKVLCSHLLKMAMQSQRAVDYSVKAYELSSPELCRIVHNSEREWHQLQSRIGDRGRTLVASGRHVDSDSLFACCALRVYSALRVTYTAATEIAQNTMFVLEDGEITESPETREMGRFANSLVRLCTVALFNKEIKHARTVLQSNNGRHSFDLSAYQAHNNLTQRTGEKSRFELAIAMSLGQIAEQACEIAEAIATWLEGNDCLGVPRERAA
jgi:phosphate uptake regulator